VRRGLPSDLRRRVEQQTADFTERQLALHVAYHGLNGNQPSWYRGKRAAQLAADLGMSVEQLERSLEVLERAGCGVGERKPRRMRNHGSRLESRLDGVTGILGRSIALRLPTTDNRKASGRYDGIDPWGPVRCNLTLRDGHKGLIAAGGGLWKRRGILRDDQRAQVDFTRGEIAYLLRAGRRESLRCGGGDIQWVSQLLRDLDRLRIKASVSGDDASEPHAIPSSPIALILVRIDDEWVTLRDYDERIADERASGRVGQYDTVRIIFSRWYSDELRHETRRPVFINFVTWRALSGAGRWLYAFLQARHTGQLGSKDFYLGEPVRYTLGLRGGHASEAAEIVRHQLADLQHVDVRYHADPARTGRAVNFEQRCWRNTRLPLFRVWPNKGVASAPRAGTRCRRPTARRPGRLRPPLRPRVTAADIQPHEVRARGRLIDFTQARAEIAQTRQLFLDSLHSTQVRRRNVGDRGGSDPPS